MVNSQLPPCELSVRDVLPAIRSIMAEKLITERKISIYRTSRLLGLTPAAVENYIKKKRGAALYEYLVRDEKFLSLVDDVITKLLSSEDANLAEYYCLLCNEGKKVLQKHGKEYPACAISINLDLKL